MVLAFAIACAALVVRRDLRRFQLGALLVTSTTLCLRALCLLIDPYHRHATLPPLL